MESFNSRLERIVKENRHRFSTGVVNSFSGSKEELKKLLDLDLYIGISGCSLETQWDLDVVKLIPLDRILFATDSPFCDINKSHISY